MCDEALNDSLAALKLIPNWFVISKMIKKLFTALHADEHTVYFNEEIVKWVLLMFIFIILILMIILM